MLAISKEGGRGGDEKRISKKGGGDEKRPGIFCPCLLQQLVHWYSLMVLVVLFYHVKPLGLKEQGTVVTYSRQLSDSYVLSIAYMDPFWPQISLSLLSQ